MSQELNLRPSTDQSNVLTLYYITGISWEPIVGHTCITTLTHFYGVPKCVKSRRKSQITGVV